MIPGEPTRLRRSVYQDLQGYIEAEIRQPPDLGACQGLVGVAGFGCIVAALATTRLDQCFHVDNDSGYGIAPSPGSGPAAKASPD